LRSYLACRRQSSVAWWKALDVPIATQAGRPVCAAHKGKDGGVCFARWRSTCPSADVVQCQDCVLLQGESEGLCVKECEVWGSGGEPFDPNLRLKRKTVLPAFFAQDARVKNSRKMSMIEEKNNDEDGN